MLVLDGAWLAVFAIGSVVVLPRVHMPASRADLSVVLWVNAVVVIALTVAWGRPFPNSALVAVVVALFGAAALAFREASESRRNTREWLHLVLLGLSWPAALAALGYAGVAARTSAGTIDGRLEVVAGSAAVLVAVIPWVRRTSRVAFSRSGQGMIVVGVAIGLGVIAAWLESGSHVTTVIAATVMLVSLALVMASTEQNGSHPVEAPGLEPGEVVRVAAIHAALGSGIAILLIVVMAALRPSRGHGWAGLVARGPVPTDPYDSSYVYVRNNPVNASDPSGACVQFLGGAVAGLATGPGEAVAAPASVLGFLLCVGAVWSVGALAGNAAKGVISQPDGGVIPQIKPGPQITVPDRADPPIRSNPDTGDTEPPGVEPPGGGKTVVG